MIKNIMKTPKSKYSGVQKKVYNILKYTGTEVIVSDIYDGNGIDTMCVKIKDFKTDLSVQHYDILAIGYIIKGFRIVGNYTVVWLRAFRA